MNLQEEILDNMAKQMSEAIDFEVLGDVLISCGWHKVKATPSTWEEGRDIVRWVEEHIVGKYRTSGSVWIFENQGDAVNFTLKWM